MGDQAACRCFHRCVRSAESEDWAEFLRLYGGLTRQAIRRAWRRRAAGLRKFGVDEEEVWQEVFCQILDGGGEGFAGRHDLQLWCWLERVAENRVADLWRYHNARKRFRPPLHDKTVRLQRRHPEANSVTPERMLLAKEGIGRFLSRCRELLSGVHPETVATVVAGAFLEGCTSQEISRASGDGLSVGQVNAMILRLRRALANEGVQLPRRTGAGKQVPWNPQHGTLAAC